MAKSGNSSRGVASSIFSQIGQASPKELLHDSIENEKIQRPISQVNTAVSSVSTAYEPNEPIESNGASHVYTTTMYDIFLPYPKAELRLELHKGTQREQLKNSIAAHGITSPIKVFPVADDKFVILSGHNRLDIAKELNIAVPYIVFNNLTDEVKDEIVAEEHILNRQQVDLLPSQMMKLLLAIQKSSSSQKELIQKSSLSKAATYIYISFELLLPELLYGWVDEKKLSLHSGQGLSRYPKEKQQIFLDYITSRNKPIPEKMMKELFSYSSDEWCYELFEKIFENKTTSQKVVRIELPESTLLSVLSKEELSNASDIIIQALKEYRENHKL